MLSKHHRSSRVHFISESSRDVTRGPGYGIYADRDVEQRILPRKRSASRAGASTPRCDLIVRSRQGAPVEPMTVGVVIHSPIFKLSSRMATEPWSDASLRFSEKCG
jgi:hypothetical protein